MLVFISHIHEEAAIAQVIKDLIESSFAGQCDVFMSSDSHDNPAGEKWLDRVKEALNSASVLLILCSPLSLHRPWINFETGGGWLRDISVMIPICHSGLTKGGLPIPMSTFQALNLGDKDFIYSLRYSLAKRLHLSEVPHTNEEAIGRELARVCLDLREKNRKVEVRIDGTFPDLEGTITFSPGPRMDLVEEVARRASLDPATFGIEWHLRDSSGQFLSPHEGVVRTFRASTGLKQVLVLTKGPR
jgi:hypothetical protein